MISCKRCHTALRLLNKLIPGFEEKAMSAEDMSSFCAPVSLVIYPTQSSGLTQI